MASGFGMRKINDNHVSPTQSFNGKDFFLNLSNIQPLAMHFQDMISKIQFNESVRQHKRKRLRKVKEAWVNAVGLYTGNLAEGKEISKEELASLKEQIREQLKRERRKAILKSAVVTLITTVIVALFLFRFLKIFLVK